MKPALTLLLAALLPLAATLQAAPGAGIPPAKPETPSKPALKPAASPPKVAPAAEPAKAPATSHSYNKLVLEAIKRMPAGGGYSVKSTATANLVAASAAKADGKGGLGFQPALAQPSYCSGATYLVFLEVINDLIKSGTLKLSGDVTAMLPVKRQPDGVGIWGRWNANGPGTGRFFYEARLGSNFVGLDKARPGDFLKLWWNEHVGKRERGHSVIFLGHEKTPEGEPGIRFWSSNEPEGMSSKVIPLTKIKRALVSRLEHPESLAALAELAPKDGFLASMLEKDCSEEEYLKSVGLPANAGITTPPSQGGTEKIVVRIDGVPDASAASTAPPAAASDPETAFMADSGYAVYSAFSKLAIIQLVQMRLRYDGCYEGNVDGRAGAVTVAAMKKWQTAAGINASGMLDGGTLLKLGLNDLAETKMTPRKDHSEVAPAGSPLLRSP